MLAKIKTFLTPPRRKAIYGVATAAGVALVAFNVVTTDQINHVVQLTVTVATSLATLMALLHTPAGGADQ